MSPMPASQLVPLPSQLVHQWTFPSGVELCVNLTFFVHAFGSIYKSHHPFQRISLYHSLSFLHHSYFLAGPVSGQRPWLTSSRSVSFVEDFTDDLIQMDSINVGCAGTSVWNVENSWRDLCGRGRPAGSVSLSRVGDRTPNLGKTSNSRKDPGQKSSIKAETFHRKFHRDQET